MRRSRIPSPQTAEDILGARLRDLKKTIEEAQNAGAGTTTVEVSSSGIRRYILPGWEFTHTEAAGSIAFFSQVECYRFRLLQALENVSTLSTYVTIPHTTSGIFGLYNADGSEKLCQWEIPAIASGARTSAPLSPPISLEPGDYWLAWSAQGVTGIETAFNGPVVSWAVVLNKAEVRRGRAVNLMVGLVLPSTLGGVTSITNAGVPAVCINTELT